MKITLNFDKSLEENAQDYFEKAKKLRKKLRGAEKAITETKTKEQTQKNQDEKEQKKTEKQKKELELQKQRKKHWYEKFRWFKSSNDFLIIAGRDASTNELIIKKHLDPQDTVFHTEMQGSPFTIIKNPEKKEIPKETILEAATFTATYSKAWDLGIKYLEVFQVKPEQVTKQAKAGEYLQKGSFMIQGKKMIHNVTINLAIGYYTEENAKIIMAGPITAVQKNTDENVKLKQGTIKKGEITKKLMHLLNYPRSEEILSMLPAGRFDTQK